MYSHEQESHRCVFLMANNTAATTTGSRHKIYPSHYTPQLFWVRVCHIKLGTIALVIVVILFIKVLTNVI